MVKWITIVLVLALAGVGFYASRSGGTDQRAIEGPGAGASPEPERAPLEIEGAAGLERGPEAGPRDARIEGAPGPEVLPNDAGENPGTGATTAFVRVEVVASDTGKPVPSAEVHWLDRTTVTQDRWKSAFRDPRVSDALVITSGRRLVADEEGVVRIPHGTNGALVGRALRMRGRTAWFGEPGDVIQLQLDPQHELLVEVVGEDEQPVPSIPITVGFERDGNLVHIIDRNTGTDGAPARFDTLPQVLSPGPSYFVTLGIPGAVHQRIAIDPDRLPPEKVRLEMPPTGSVVVHVVDADGSTFKGPANVSVGRFSGNDAFYAEVRSPLSAGRVTFAHVALGAHLAFRVEGPAARPPLDGEHVGPLRPGESVDVRLMWTGRYPLLVGRAVDDRGDLQVARRGLCRVLVDGVQVDGAALTPDDDGRFEIPLRSTWSPGSERRLTLMLFQSAGFPKSEASLDLSYELSNEDIDLGDVVFAAAPLLAAGRVRDSVGKAVGGALVRVQWRRSASSDEAVWATGKDVGVTTDARGYFEIYGALDPGDMRVSCLKRGFKRVESPAIDPGTRNVELVLEPGIDIPTVPAVPRGGG